MKIGVNLSVFPQAVSFDDRLKMAADAGCDGIEINIESAQQPSLDSTSEEIASYKSKADEFNLEIPTVHCGLHWKYTLTDPDPEVRQKSIEVLTRSLEIGSELDAKVLLVVPGVVKSEVTYRDAYARAQEGIATLAEKAASLGMKIGVENVWNKFLLSPLEMRRFIEEIGSEAVGAYFDVGNILAYGFPHHWIDVLDELICAVHVKDYRLDVPGSGGFVHLGHGDVPWKEVQDALRRVGWDGYITAEVPPYRFEGQGTVYEVVRSMRRVLGING